MESNLVARRRLTNKGKSPNRSLDVGNGDVLRHCHRARTVAAEGLDDALADGVVIDDGP
jgi:hypothetical protein